MAKNDHIWFKSNLGEIKKGKNKKGSKEQKNALYNIEMLYKARSEAIKFLVDYSLMVSVGEMKQGIKQVVKNSKYQLPNNCFKDYR